MQAETNADQLHGLAAGGAGEGVQREPLPGCVHAGGAGAPAGPGGVQGPGKPRHRHAQPGQTAAFFTCLLDFEALGRPGGWFGARSSLRGLFVHYRSINKGLLNYAWRQPIDLLVNKRRHSLNKPSNNSLLSFYNRIILTFPSAAVNVMYLVIVNHVKMLLLKHE